ncbi:MAG: hypothetical protein ACRC6K_04690 [Fusobacteriaceae bacterium]
MKDEEILREEIEEFKREKERIKDIVGEIGGTSQNKQHRIVNALLMIIIAIILIAGVALKKIDLVVTLEVAILIGIFKIIWILYEFQRINHFQFWILNSLEFRINEIHKKVKKIEKDINSKENNSKDDLN